MKKIKLLKYLGTGILCSTTPLVLLTSCSEKEPEPEPEPGVPTIYGKPALFHEIYSTSSSPTGPLLYGVSDMPPMMVYTINDSPVPYLDVDSYVKTEMHFGEIGEHDYDSSTNNNVTTITNKFNNATCTIDYENQTLTFSDYDNFLNNDYDSENPLATGCGGGENWFIEVVNEYTAPSQPFVIDLTKYNIKIYCIDNKGYLPYEMFRNILNPYPNGNWFYNGEGFYQISTANQQNLVDLYQIPRSCMNLNSEYMEYTYNMLALTLDTRFGMTERISRSSPGTTIKYFENGAYEALEPFHKELVSTDPDVSNTAMRKFFNKECDDGGHAGYSGVNVLNSVPTPSSLGRGPETSRTNEIFKAMDSAREASGYWNGFTHDADIDYILEAMGIDADPEQDIDLMDTDNDGVNDIAWVTFDGFDYPIWSPDYDDVLDNSWPYQYDTVSMTMKLQQIVNTGTDNSKIENIVIDLTNNGGGTVCTEHFLASYLCGRDNQCEPQSTTRSGGVTHTLYNPHTGAFGKYTLYADINQDGVYDEDDYLPSDVNVYCITSGASFSCANMLPCDLASCSNCKFIGDTSGGGACFVDSNMLIGLGNVFRSSSNFHMLKNQSTISNKISVDSGNLAEFYHLDSLAEPAKFFNRSDIIAKILG